MLYRRDVSLLDAMLGPTDERHPQRLNLPKDVRLALLRLDSPIHSIVELAVAMENGDWDAIDRLTDILGIEGTEAFRLHTESIAWASQMQPAANECD